LRKTQWEAILWHFINDKSSNYISSESDIERRRVLRSLLLLRRAIADNVKNVLDVRTTDVLSEIARAFPLQNTRQRPLFVLLGRKNHVFATAVPREGRPRLVERLKKCPVSFSFVRWEEKSGLVGTYLYEVGRLTPAAAARQMGSLLEGFWEYLRGSLVGRGGIRHKRLPLYLAECAWKYNHRRLSRERKLNQLLNLLRG